MTAHVIRELYPHAMEMVFRHAESPIERYFVGTLLISFMIRDPLGFLMRPPFFDAPRQMASARRVLSHIREAERAVTDANIEGMDFKAYLEALEREGEITAETHAFTRQWHILGHVLGFYSAFHISMQAQFPELRVAGKAVRADLVIYVPASTLSVVVECDGYQWHSSRDAFIADRQRDRLLTDAGFTVLRYSGSEINKNPVTVSVELFERLHRMHSLPDGA